MATSIPPPNGTPLDNPPQGIFGSRDPAQWSQSFAWNDFVQMFGRNPTQSELDQLSGYYYSGDPNIPNQAVGRQAVSAYFNQLSAPTAIQLQQKQQQEGLAAYQKGQSGFDQTVGGAFSSLLGRQATSEELSHFGSLLATGQTDPYQLAQYLKQTPEYANAQDTQFRNQLGGQLDTINSQFFKNYIQPDVIGSFAAQGRDTSGLSSGLSYALAQQAGQMQSQTQQYLAQLGAQQYAGRQGQATQDYQTQLAQQYGVQNASLGNQLSNQNALQQQNWNNINSGQQRQFLMSYLNANKPQGPNPLGGAFSGALGGASMGSKFGPYGAIAGGIGGGLFGYGAAGGF